MLKKTWPSPNLHEKSSGPPPPLNNDNSLSQCRFSNTGACNVIITTSECSKAIIFLFDLSKRIVVSFRIFHYHSFISFHYFYWILPVFFASGYRYYWVRYFLLIFVYFAHAIVSSPINSISTLFINCCHRVEIVMTPWTFVWFLNAFKKISNSATP
jgi:hypothetical protein